MAAALLITAIFWLLAWYISTVHTMVALWRSTDEFAHGFLIVPISAWLIWRRRHAIDAVEFVPDWRALPVLGLVGLCWLLGQLAGANVVEQFAVMLMVPLIVWAILGHRLVRTLAFPLGFLLFAVPFGKFLEAPLMEYTADFTVAALKLSGIPVYREGQFFMIPSGSWSVVEACSGLRYLIASLTVGVLYAHLFYRSLKRRSMFIVLSLILPVVANWIRAYLIVIIGHVIGINYAVGVDHLIYGWLFFAFVVLLMFWIGSLWREDQEALPVAPAPLAVRVQPSPLPLLVATSAVAGIVALWPHAADRMQAVRQPSQPVLSAPGATGEWQPVSAGVADWSPRFVGASAYLHQTYGKGTSGAGLYVAYYRNQRSGSQLISSANTLAASGDAVWRNIGETRRTIVLNDAPLPLTEATLRATSTTLDVWYCYWIAGQYVANPYWAKVLQAKSLLFGRGDDAAVVIVYAPRHDRPEISEPVLRDFLRAMLPSVTQSLQHSGQAKRDKAADL